MKKIITIIVTAVFVLIAVLPITNNELQVQTNSVLSKNIEALTTPENIDTAYGYKKQRVKVNGERKDCCVVSLPSDKCSVAEIGCIVISD